MGYACEPRLTLGCQDAEPCVVLLASELLKRYHNCNATYARWFLFIVRSMLCFEFLVFGIVNVL